MILLARPTRHHGVVVSFDVDRGFGAIEVDGGETVGFHCVAIADGSRTIDVGTAVTCDLVRGRAGEIEATNIG